MVEDVTDVFLGASITWDDILLRIKSVWLFDGAFLRKGEPRRLGDGSFATAPPSQLSHVGQNDTRRLGIIRRCSLGLDVFDKVDSRPGIDAIFAANDSMGEDANVLSVLIKQNHHPLLSLEVGRDEDWEVGLIITGTQWKSNLL
jgi:hypothetical protein